MADRTVSVRLRAEVTDYMAKFAAAGKATGDLANKVDKAKGRTKAGMQMIGSSMLVAGGLVAAGFALSVKEMSDFESRLALVRTLSHATAPEMSKLRDAALTAGQAYGFTAGQVADAEGELVKAGVSVKDILGGALTGALTLAAAGQTDVADATETAAIAMTQFKLSGKDVPHIADLLAAGADKALGSVHDLSMGLQSGGLVAAQFGASVDDTVGTLAAFAQAGLLGEKGGTVLRQMFLKLAAPSTASAGIMKQLGIHTYDAAGQFVGLTKLAGQLKEKLTPLTQAQRDNALATIFGARAIQGANVLYQLGTKGLEAWIKTVNDSGFAALQAAGKLDSLSGDVTKFKSELNAALIEGGSNANGMLRTMVQDATDVLRAWNALPGPVRTVALAIVGLGGAVSLAGGAALVFIPRWSAMNLVLKETRMGAISASTALKRLGQATAAIAVLTALYEGLKLVEHALAPVPPDIDLLTSAVTTFAKQGIVSGELAKAFGGNLSDLGDEANKILSGGALDHLAEKLPFAHGFGGASDIREATADFKSLDAALSGLVTSGSAGVASTAFSEMNKRLHAAGLTTAQITKLFPEYSKSLASSAASAQAAGTGIDQYGNDVSDSAQKVKAATDANKAYDDQLHAMADPLFAMNKALQDLAAKQAAAAKATRQHGADSKAARQSNLDLASSALDVKVASTDLTTAVATGAVTMRDATGTVRGWAKAGLITKAQADDIIKSFDALIGRAKTLAGLHPKVIVTADVNGALNEVKLFKSYLDGLHDKTVTIYAQQSGPGHHVMVPGHAAGGAISGGTPGRDSVPAMLMPGEFVVRRDGSNLGDALHFFGAPGFAKGGAVAAAERAYASLDPRLIARALLAGNFDQVIERAASKLGDKAAKAFEQLAAPLKHSLDHLGSVVANARQYQSSARSNLTSYADIGGAASSGVGTLTYKRAKLNDLKKFAHLYHRLERQGLDKTALGEFFAAGPAAIPAMENLLATPGGVAKENRLDHQIGKLSSRLAGAATGDQYGAQIVAGLRALPGPIGKEVGKAVARELKHIHIEIHDGGRTVVRRRRAG